MQLSSSTTPFRVVALLAVLMLAFGAAMAVSAEQLPPSAYSVSVAPDTCEAATTCTLTFTFTNRSPDSAALLTEASITPPAGFTLVEQVNGYSITVSAAAALVQKTWSAEAVGNTVFLEADEPQISNGLAPTETVSVSVPVTASLDSLGPGHRFDTRAFGFLLPATDLVEFTQVGEEPSVTVVNDEAQCNPDFGCETETITLENTSAKAVGSVGRTLQFLTLSVGGNFLDPDSKCQDSATFKSVGHPVTTNLTDPPDRSHEVTLTLDKSVDNSAGAPGAERIQICAVSDSQFLTSDGTLAEQNQETDLYEGFLPNCPPVPVTKCVLSRSRDAGKSVIRYFVEPGDPISIPGIGEL